MEFEVVVMDPPWSFDDKLKLKDNVKRSAASQYKTMSLAELKEMKIPFAKDCVLAIWCPSSLFFDQALELLKHWKFKPKQIFTWLKLTKKGKISIGMGRLFRGATEHVIIAVKGKPYKMLKNKSQRNVVMSLNKRHSEKPDDLQNSLELMFPTQNKLEMFARRIKKNWICIGNEITKNDINVDLEIISNLNEEEVKNV